MNVKYCLTTLVFACAVALCAAPCRAGDLEYRPDFGIPVENRITGRDIAVRVRTEIQVSEDDEGLLEEDISYAQFPVTMYAAAVDLIHSNGYSLGVSLDAWENRQDLQSYRPGWEIGVPVGNVTRFYFKHRHYEWPEDPARDYFYAGLSILPWKSIYSYTQYGMLTEEGETIGHQVSQYLNYSLSTGTRLGGQVGATFYDVDTLDDSLFVSLFANTFVWKRSTSVGVEGRYYAAGDYQYQEYRASVYQKLGKSSLLRAGYRYYLDDEMDSNSVDLKFRHYFTKRLSAHVGYRWYWHSDGTDFNTVLAGVGLVL